VLHARPGLGVSAAAHPGPGRHRRLAAALAVLLSAVNVYLRDTQHLIEVSWWPGSGPAPSSTPFQSSKSICNAHQLFIPHTKLIWLYFANPVTPLVMTFQRVFYNIWSPR
jgi:ABC-2 type transport system permease protein